LGLFSLSCGGLDGTDDLLLWRPCEGTELETCDFGQKCLPHSWENGQAGNFRCRNLDSIRPGQEGERPPAYCDDDIYLCPSPAVCTKERVSDPVRFRARICTLPAAKSGDAP